MWCEMNAMLFVVAIGLALLSIGVILCVTYLRYLDMLDMEKGSPVEVMDSINIEKESPIDLY